MITSFLGYKGGVGKTTPCVNTAGFLRRTGKSVLVVDLNPQANATSALGIDLSSVDLGINDVVDPAEGILEGPEGIHILSSKGERVEEIPDLNLDYDFILIDTPPSSREAVSDVSFACFDCGILALESFRYLGVRTENAIVCKYRWFTDREIIAPLSSLAMLLMSGRAASVYSRIADWLLH
jgi:chromosome partitioning protein